MDRFRFDRLTHAFPWLYRRKWSLIFPIKRVAWRLMGADASVFRRFEECNMRLLESCRGRRVLDAGCGTGDFVWRLGEAHGALAAGMDISPGMIAEASRRHPEFEFRVGSADRLDDPDGAYQVIYLRWVMHHVPVDQAAGVLRECLRVASERVIIVDVVAFEGGLTGRLAQFYWRTFDGGYLYRTWAQWKQLAAEAGAEVVESLLPVSGHRSSFIVLRRRGAESGTITR
ncbi:MAG: class I SAM-dependent methyltransferase [Candidatus Dormibacteria bacterium]